MYELEENVLYEKNVQLNIECLYEIILPFLCPGGVLPPPVPGAGGGHHAEGGRQGGEVIQGSHGDVSGVIIMCHSVTLLRLV